MTLQPIIKKAFRMPKRHIPSRAVKLHLAQNFWKDGHLFIARFDQLSTCSFMEHRDFRAKVVVDLAMSIECSLKSLIISLSKDDETPADAYKKARKKNHNLVDLLAEVTVRAKKRLRIPQKKARSAISDLKLLGVGSRYSYEIWLLRFQSSSASLFVGEDLISRTIDKNDWIVSVRHSAILLNKVASTAQSRFMSKHGILSGSRLKAYTQAMSQFIQDAI